MKRALITGITGQDGAYLAQLLLSKGYEVCGTFRRSSSDNFWRLRYLDIMDHEHLSLRDMDIMDPFSIAGVLQEFKPEEIYNLAAQSFVQTSFTQPVLTANATGVSVTNMLECIRQFLPSA